MDPKAILIAVIAVLITIVLLTFYVFKKKVKRHGVLLMGLSDAGKTLIYSRLVNDKYVDTVTSMKENVSEYKTSATTLQLIDIPGQERVRVQIFDRFKSSARGVVYVVDSNTVQKDMRDVAEYLHQILCDETINANQPDVLILCNKQDETLGKSSASVQKMLEKELNIVRETKESKRKLDRDEKGKDITLGDLSKPFEFGKLPWNITFAESSAVVASNDSGPDLDALEDWLNSLL